MAKRYLLWTMDELTTEPDRDVAGIETQEGVQVLIYVHPDKTILYLPLFNKFQVVTEEGTPRIIISPIEKPVEEPST